MKELCLYANILSLHVVMQNSYKNEFNMALFKPNILEILILTLSSLIG